MRKFNLVLILAIVTACTPKDPGHVDLPDSPPAASPATPTPTPVPPSKDPVQAPTHAWIKPSWEKYPENYPWTDFAAELVRKEIYQDLDAVRDAERFCPAWKRLVREARVNFWVELISQVALYESSWKPTSRMTETTMGIDPITKKQVESEGLLQLSYQDIQWAPYCAFDWSKDKLLKATDPKKTILDPYRNLNCGMRILADQIKRTGKIVLSEGVYWSVLKEGGKYRKISEISTATKKLKFCQ